MTTTNTKTRSTIIDKRGCSVCVAATWFVAGLCAALPAHAQEGGAPGKAPGGAAASPTPAATGETTDKQPADKTGEKKEEKKEEKVRTGTIANSGNFGFGPQTIDSDAGGGAPGDEASVISGSVSYAGKGKCLVSISNASKDNSYFASYTALGYNARGIKTMTKSFSESLKPGETKKKEMSCQDDLNLSLDLRSARKK